MLKALILDDAKVIRSLLKLTLKSDGIEVDDACTLEEAFELVENNHYDLMIIDYMLDDQRNGLELVSAVQQHNKHQDTPIIMLSAEDGLSCKQDAQMLGVKAWVKKPFTPPGILKVVYRVIGRDFSQADPEHQSIHHHE